MALSIFWGFVIVFLSLTLGIFSKKTERRNKTQEDKSKQKSSSLNGKNAKVGKITVGLSSYKNAKIDQTNSDSNLNRAVKQRTFK